MGSTVARPRNRILRRPRGHLPRGRGGRPQCWHQPGAGDRGKGAIPARGTKEADRAAATPRGAGAPRTLPGRRLVHDARSIANREAPGWRDQPLHDLETAYFAGRAATYREAEEVGLNVGTNQGLEIVAKARYRLAELKRRTEQPPHLAALARRARSRVGASHATKLHPALRPYPEAAALYRSAGDAGRAAGTPDGLEIAERVRDILRAMTEGWPRSRTSATA